uniref:Uncharacterized protein n=1 Tax=uncultured crenarchaeote TaxID=29281 RepID=Q2V9E9_9CREN|nr:hypothetical protein [uncultured crenarchaeote]
MKRHSSEKSEMLLLLVSCILISNLLPTMWDFLTDSSVYPSNLNFVCLVLTFWIVSCSLVQYCNDTAFESLMPSNRTCIPSSFRISIRA